MKKMIWACCGQEMRVVSACLVEWNHEIEAGAGIHGPRQTTEGRHQMRQIDAHHFYRSGNEKRTNWRFKRNEIRMINRRSTTIKSGNGFGFHVAKLRNQICMFVLTAQF